MLGSEIYSDFKYEMIWISDWVSRDVIKLPTRLRRVGKRLVGHRLGMVPDWIQISRFDPELGRPVPYIIFWFADCFGFRNRDVTKSFALAQVYSSMVTTLRDDAADLKSMESDQLLLLELADIFQEKYLNEFKRAFGTGSNFWHYLAFSMNDQLRYESWNRSFVLRDGRTPFTERYLEDSSRYVSAVLMPSLHALAIYAGAEERIGEIARLLKHYTMGWRIWDDIRDWREDLGVENMNHSCFLLFAKHYLGKNDDPTEEDILSLFMSEDFIRKLYSPILLYYTIAQKDALVFNSHYLNKFAEEQLSFHTRMRDTILKGQLDTYSRLEGMLSKL